MMLRPIEMENIGRGFGKKRERELSAVTSAGYSGLWRQGNEGEVQRNNTEAASDLTAETKELDNK